MSACLLLLGLLSPIVSGCVVFYDTSTTAGFPDPDVGVTDVVSDAQTDIEADAGSDTVDVADADITSDVETDADTLDVSEDTEVSQDVDDADGDLGSDPDAEPVDEDNDGFVFPDDCEPTDPNSYPGASEVCDGVDNDCDGQIDDGLPVLPFHPDVDGDGFGDETAEVMACGPRPGLVSDGTDCDDASAAANPDGVEVCDHVDNDCDGTVDFTGWIPDDAATIAEAASIGGHYCVDEGTWNFQSVRPAAPLVLEGLGTDRTLLSGGGERGFDTRYPLTIKSVAVINTVAHEELGGFIDSVEGDVVLEDVVFRDPVLNRGYGMLVQLGNASFHATDVTISNAAVNLTNPWYGFFYVYSGLMDLNRVEVHHASVVTSNDIYGTFYHYRGSARLRDVAVRDSSFVASGAMDGLVFTEEETGQPVSLIGITAVDNSATVSGDYFGAISLGNQDGDVTVENVRLSGNSVEADTIYTVVGYASPEPNASWTGVIVAGERLEATGGSVRIGQSLGDGPVLRNWDIAYNTAISENSRPILELHGNASLRNLTVIGNNVGTAFNHVARAEEFSVRYCNIVEPGASNAFIEDDENYNARNSISADPLYTDIESNPSSWNLRPLEGSPVIDAGDPSIRDTDSTRSDIGAFGGPTGDNWAP